MLLYLNADATLCVCAVCVSLLGITRSFILALSLHVHVKKEDEKEPNGTFP